MAPKFLLLLFAALFAFVNIASAQSRNASDVKKAFQELLAAKEKQQDPYWPPLNDSTTAAANKSPDYVRQLLLMFGPIRGNAMHGFIDNNGTNERRFKFNVSVDQTKFMTFAELQMYKLPSQQYGANPNSTVSVYISDIYSGQRMSSRRVSMETIGWLNFTLSLDIISRWNRDPASNAGIEVHISNPNRSSLIRFATRQVNSSLEVLLLVHCTDLSRRSFPKGVNFPPFPKPQRRMRSVRSLHSSHKGPCGRHNLSVHFKDLGWDKWVIAPREYPAYYCAGTCTDPDVSMANHARIQLFLSVQDPSLANGPCCVPNELGSTELLFYGDPGESTYILRRMEEFVVMSCVCQ